MDKIEDLSLSQELSIETDVPFGVIIEPRGEQTYVGNTINVLTAYGPEAKFTKATIFKNDIYKNEDYIISEGVSDSESFVEVSESLTEVFKAFELSATMSTGKAVPFFSGGIEVKYGASGEVKNTTKFCNAIASCEMTKHSLKSSHLRGTRMRNIVQEDVLFDIDDATFPPDELIENYGTHIIAAASIGGNIQINGRYISDEKISTSDFSAAINFACSYIKASADVKKNEKFKSIVSNTQIHTKSSGGNVEIASEIRSLDEMGTSFSNWAKSIAEHKETHVLSKVYKYVPIWELAANETRKGNIKDAFMAIASTNYEKINKYFNIEEPLNDPVRIHLYGNIQWNQTSKVRWPLYPKPHNSPNEASSYLSCSSESRQVSSFNDMILSTNQDKTKSIVFVKYDVVMSVHYLTTDWNKKYDTNQISFVKALIGERQKFVFTECAGGVKIKSVFNGKFLKDFKATIKLRSDGPVEEIAFRADADEDTATVFEIVKV